MAARDRDLSIEAIIQLSRGIETNLRLSDTSNDEGDYTMFILADELKFATPWMKLLTRGDVCHWYNDISNFFPKISPKEVQGRPRENRLKIKTHSVVSRFIVHRITPIFVTLLPRGEPRNNGSSNGRPP